MLSREELHRIFDKWCKKLRIVPFWDVKLELVEDVSWRKTGDIKIDCDDKKAVIMLNIGNPKQENLEEVLAHELFHLKLYPLDQVTESLSVFYLNLEKIKSFPMEDVKSKNHIMSCLTD